MVQLALGLEFDRDAARPFFDRMPDLFQAYQREVDDAYQSLLYSVEHSYSPDDLRLIEQRMGLDHPTWTKGSCEQAIQLLDGMRYPDAAPISTLRAVPGLDLRTLSHYLHFFHHVYPIYDRQSCRGLQRLGLDVPYMKLRDADVYALYTAAVETLKERAPYWSFPEYNVSLQRVVQAALHALGQEDD